MCLEESFFCCLPTPLACICAEKIRIPLDFWHQTRCLVLELISLPLLKIVSFRWIRNRLLLFCLSIFMPPSGDNLRLYVAFRGKIME